MQDDAPRLPLPRGESRSETPERTPKPPALELRNLTVAFHGRKVVQNASLTIPPGTILGLTGDAGSGKSTLGLAILGLTQQGAAITAGQVLLDGTDLLARPERERRAIRGRDVALITQNPRGALSPLHTIGNQVGATLRAHRGASRAEATRHAIDTLRSLGLNDPERRIHAYPHEISGGMAQRVLIAMALGAGPRLLIADEPTSGLDVTIQAAFLDDMWRTIRASGSARGTAMLLITQDPGIIANYCDQVVVMEHGRITEHTGVPAFFAAPSSAYGQAVLGLRREAPPPPPPPGPPLLALDALTKRFPVRGSRKQVQAVDQVTLTIGRGETLGLVGESGSGKTTVGRTLLRLVEPTSGRVLFDGTDITAAAPAALQRLRPRMQIVFQDPLDSLDPRWTVGRIVMEGAAPGQSAEALLHQVGLPPAIAALRPRQLSGGDQQRVGIARAIAPDPALIVLDEPTSMLPPLARLGIIALLRRLQLERGLAYLFISHDLTTVEHLCHRVAVMYLGQVVELGTRDQVFRTPTHPYSKALLAAHLAPDPGNRRVDKSLPALTGEIPSPIDLPKGCYLATRCPVAEAECRTTPQPLLPLLDGRQIRCLPSELADSHICRR